MEFPWHVVLLAGVLNSCAFLESLEVQTDPKAVPDSSPKEKVIRGPDPGAGLPLRTLYFEVEGYGDTTQNKATVAEKIYSTVMDQTALYSFKPKENYRLVIYKDKREYEEKTKQPEWSGGMSYKNGVYTYEQGGIDAVLAHEITHLIFGEFMGEEAQNHRWLNEGLAMYIDAHFHSVETYDQQSGGWLERIKPSDIYTLKEILEFKVYSERSRNVNRWYNTVASLTAYLIEDGGSFPFSLFLTELKAGVSPDKALEKTYPGKFRSLEELHSLWMGFYGLN